MRRASIEREPVGPRSNCVSGRSAWRRHRRRLRPVVDALASLGSNDDATYRRPPHANAMRMNESRAHSHHPHHSHPHPPRQDKTGKLEQTTGAVLPSLRPRSPAPVLHARPPARWGADEAPTPAAAAAPGADSGGGRWEPRRPLRQQGDEDAGRPLPPGAAPRRGRAAGGDRGGVGGRRGRFGGALAGHARGQGVHLDPRHLPGPAERCVALRGCVECVVGSSGVVVYTSGVLACAPCALP